MNHPAQAGGLLEPERAQQADLEATISPPLKRQGILASFW